MAESRQKGGFKNLNKTFAGWCKTLRGELEHSADISFSPWSGRKRNPVCSVCSFLGRHASIFTLAERGSDVYVWLKVSLYTRILWGALLPWLEAEPWVNDSRRKVTADDNYNINIWEWERHPGKKVKAVCSQEQLGGGCPLWDSQADKQKGEQIAHHTAELRWEDPAYQRSYLDHSAKIDKLFMLNLDKNDSH